MLNRAVTPSHLPEYTGAPAVSWSACHAQVVHAICESSQKSAAPGGKTQLGLPIM